MQYNTMQRIDYVSGLFLTSQLCQSEQNYFMQWLTYQNQALFSPGVMQGLSLQGNSAVTVGIALDSNGHLLVLNENYTFPPLTNSDGSYPLYIGLATTTSNNLIQEQAVITIGDNSPVGAVQIGTVTIRDRAISALTSDNRQMAQLKLAVAQSQNQTLAGVAEVTSLTAQTTSVSQTIYFDVQQKSIFNGNPVVHVTPQTEQGLVAVSVNQTNPTGFTVTLKQLEGEPTTVNLQWIASGELNAAD